jgi:hypothetical protein
MVPSSWQYNMGNTINPVGLRESVGQSESSCQAADKIDGEA